MAAAQDSRPAYVQVAETLRREIAEGRFQPGERLPSVRDLAIRFDIAPVTTRHAMTVLRDAGWIYSQSTRGYFVREDLPAGDAPVQPSDAYVVLRQHLEAVQTAVDQLGSRLSHLEHALLDRDPAAGRPTPATGDEDSRSRR